MLFRSAQVICKNTTGMLARRLTPADLDKEGHSDMQRLFEMTMAVTSAPAGQPATVVVDGDVTFFLSIKHNLVAQEPVEQTLERMIHFVEGIVPRFEPYLVKP